MDSIKGIFLLLLLAGMAWSCNTGYFRSDTTLRKERERFKTSWEAKCNDMAVTNSPLTDAKILEFAWGTMAFNLKNEIVETGYRRILRNWGSLPESTQYKLLLSVYALYPDWNPEQILPAHGTIKDSRTQVLLHHWKLQQGLGSDSVLTGNHPYAEATQLQNDFLELDSVALKSIISQLINANQKHLLFFIPNEARIPGRLVIVGLNRKLQLDEKGKAEIFRFLALSASGAPWYLTFGDTPSGVYSIQSVHTTDNPFIGPVPLLETGLPFELTPCEYWHGLHTDSLWSKEIYELLIPPVLMSLHSMRQAWLAGKLGRSEIVMHGSTIDPDFFSGESFYPFTPSLGCMTAYEVWDEETGCLVESDQLRLINVWEKTPGDSGFLWVIRVGTKDPHKIEQWIHNLTAYEPGNQH